MQTSICNAARSSHHWKKGAAPTSLKALNASVYDTLPKPTEAICHSLATFTRFLVGYNKSTKAYPPGPTVDERCHLRPLTQAEIMSDRQVFLTEPVTVDNGVPEAPLDRFKMFAQNDLRRHGINRLTFDWAKADRDIWNRTMAIFVVKHWQYAKSQGALKQSVDSAHNTESNCIGIVLRWIRGRTVEIRQERQSDDKYRKKETRRKKRVLFKYRCDSLSRLLLAAKIDQQASDILPHHDCCSETEWEPENTHYPSVGLIWRSPQYTKVLHQIDKLSYKYSSSTQGPLLASQRFDQCRTSATHNDPKAAVCPGLPENCYEPTFLAYLTPEEKTALRIKPVSSWINTLPNQIQNFAV
ncbi:uncharacterized protein MELLADRAFT_92372 [Melampsora larici-populina 98AG31]|uniref:Uncharacterized protein n=1 Tax=Melampsora larici-populina (strain 98AG31 / pathotype 3-4-7) TaxID=747676 RepID=F4R9D8_MELLP|nr:uncharacterized protein MELLADRAFT_92372 [Melampsora larici-populina 98AG31]EGG10969.1 hypothetical protein MELLADRAFT_92372 [Melampsora larici-populina 98AG31]